MVSTARIAAEVLVPMASSDPAFCYLGLLFGHGSPSLACPWSCLPKHTAQLPSLASGCFFSFLGIMLPFSSFPPSNLEEASPSLREIHLSSYFCLLNPLLLDFQEWKLDFCWRAHSCPYLGRGTGPEWEGQGIGEKGADTESYLEYRDNTSKYHFHAILGFSYVYFICKNYSQSLYWWPFLQVAEFANSEEPTSVYPFSVTYQIGYLVEETQIVSCAVKLPFCDKLLRTIYFRWLANILCKDVDC